MYTHSSACLGILKCSSQHYTITTCTYTYICMYLTCTHTVPCTHTSLAVCVSELYYSQCDQYQNALSDVVLLAPEEDMKYIL